MVRAAPALGDASADTAFSPERPFGIQAFIDRPWSVVAARTTLSALT